MGQNPAPTAKLQVPLGVWISLGAFALALVVQFFYVAKSFGSFEATMAQYGKDIESFRNSTTQTKLNELEVTLARTQEQSMANKDEIRSIRWQINRLTGSGGSPNWQPNNSTINKNTTGP